MVGVTYLIIFVVVLIFILTLIAGIIGLVIFLISRNKQPKSRIIPEVQADDVVKCSNCGNICYANQTFCDQCGNKLYN